PPPPRPPPPHPPSPTRRSSDLIPAAGARRPAPLARQLHGGGADRRAPRAARRPPSRLGAMAARGGDRGEAARDGHGAGDAGGTRSEEHTSELQSHLNLVCRLLL